MDVVIWLHAKIASILALEGENFIIIRTPEIQIFLSIQIIRYAIPHLPFVYRPKIAFHLIIRN